MVEGISSILFGGVDINVEGEGGPNCLNYLSPTQRIIETIIFCSIAIFILKKSYQQIKLPMKSRYPPSLSSRQQVLLSLHMLVFGVELGFKFASRSLIWIFNPCHVLTIIQSFILFLHPSPFLTAVYRIHIHMMNGPILAMLFPITGQRFLPLEKATYYVQHFNILFIPPMLIKPESPFSVEPLTDFSWALFSLGLQTLYHFLVLQPIGLYTGINMNNMICPGVSDPFASRYYRIIAMIHQPLMVLTVGKLFSTMFITFKKSRLLRAELNPPRVTAEFPEPPYGKDWHLISYNCQAVTESTTSPWTSKRFNKFYYSAIPISMTKVEETRACEATFDEFFLNQNILFVPIEDEDQNDKESCQEDTTDSPIRQKKTD